MSKYAIEDSTLIAIGDAIREKAGTTNSMTPSEMVTAILAITGGGGGAGGNTINVKAAIAPSVPSQISSGVSWTLDLSSNLGTTDEVPFCFIFNGSTTSSGDYGFAVLYYDGEGNFQLLAGKNSTLGGSAYKNFKTASIEAGVLSISFKSSFYVSGDREFPYVYWEIIDKEYEDVREVRY